VRAIIAGERDGRVLATMKNVRIRASEADIEKSLRGNWRPEHLFALGQAMALFDAYGEQLAACDRQLGLFPERGHPCVATLHGFESAAGEVGDLMDAGRAQVVPSRGS
jgi:hypothetical protein